MVTAIIALFLLVLFAIVIYDIYDHLEISILKYGLLKAIASQSTEVDKALRDLLRTRDNHKIVNKEFKYFEKLYLRNLNNFLIKRYNADNRTIRQEILLKKDIIL